MEVHLRKKSWSFFRKFCCLWFFFILNYFNKSSQFFLIMRRSSFVCLQYFVLFSWDLFFKILFWSRICALFVLLIPYLWMVGRWLPLMHFFLFEDDWSMILGILAVFLFSQSKHLGHQNSCCFYLDVELHYSILAIH